MMAIIDIDSLNHPGRVYRDPQPDRIRYFYAIDSNEYFIGSKNYSNMLRLVETEAQASFNHGYSSRYVGKYFERWWLMYAVGESLATCCEQIHSDLNIFKQLQDLKAVRWGVGVQAYEPRLYGASHDEELAAMCFCALLVSDVTLLTQFLAMQYSNPSKHLPAMDFLLDAFAPEGVKRPVKYEKAPTYQAMWDALMLALAPEGREAKSQGLARYMAGWNRLMKPLGWKPQRVYCPLADDGRQVDPNCQGDQLFYRFAFEAALAVCAFDLDDSAFSDHPYYPRDLVEYYRANVRWQRDGWRAEGAAPRFAAPVPPAPEKSDLSKSKFSGVKRWVELACDGNVDAYAAVMGALQGARSLKKNSEEAVAALSEAGQCLCADIKDDATVEAQLEELLRSREASALFEGSAVDGQGLQRALALLDGAQRGLQASESTHRLLLIDMGRDSWQALLVAQAFVQEFVDLSEQLGFTGRIKV